MTLSRSEASEAGNSEGVAPQDPVSMLVNRLKWTRDRWQDVMEDADELAATIYGKAALEQGGKIGGIFAVAQNERYACDVVVGGAARKLRRSDLRIFDSLRRAVDHSYDEDLAVEAERILDVLEPFVYAAEEFALAHVASDHYHGLNDMDAVDEEILQSSDDDYNLTKRALVDAYGSLVAELPPDTFPPIGNK